MVTVNDDIAVKLAAEFPGVEKSGTALLQRYRAGDISMRMDGFGTSYLISEAIFPHISDRIFVAVDLSMDDWSAAAYGVSTLMSKWEILFSLRAWLFQISATGNLIGAYSPNGALERVFTSSAAVGFADGSRHAVAMDIDTTNAGNRTCTFYTATTIDQGDWVQLGAVQSVAGEEAITNVTIQSVLGGDGAVGFVARQAGANFYRAQVKTGGLNGTIVSDVRFDAPNVLGIGPNQSVPDSVLLSGWRLNQGAVPASWATSSVLVYSPNTAALAITGDIDVRVKVSLADWTPAATHWIINHGNHTDAPPSLKWTFSVHPNNTIRCFASVDGTLTGVGPESVATGFVDGSEHFIRWTMDADDGAGNSIFTYMESFDNGQSWVNIGSPIVDAAGPVTMFATTKRLEIGRLNPGGQNLKYAEVRNGIGGPIVVAADFEHIPNPSSGYVDLVGTRWHALNGGPRPVQVSDRETFDELVAHYAGASANNNFVDDQWAFWNAFVP